MTVGAPRGTGKTSVLWGVALWALLSGASKFPVVAGYSHAGARRVLRKWMIALADNKRIGADYPEYCQPFRETVNPLRLKALTWEATGDPCGAEVKTGDGIIVLPDNRGALGAISVNGNARGINAAMQDGTTLRPDVLLIDDPQDRKTALRPNSVRKVIERIESDLFSLAGPTSRLAMMAAVTVIEIDDVAEHFLTSPDFEAVRVAQILTWPEGFTERGSATRKLWEAWNIERQEGLADHDDGKRALEFYAAHRAEMVEGMTVSWSSRRDKKRHDPDALYSAMYDYYRLGERAFMAERQNQPLRSEVTVYDLSPADLAQKIEAGRQQCIVPTTAVTVVAATDINDYGDHTAVIAFAGDQTAAVLWYGCFDYGGRGIVDKNTVESEKKRLHFEALVGLGKQMATLPLSRGGTRARPALWVIDAGYLADVSRRYAEGPGRTLGIQTVTARGYGFDKYRPSPKNCIGAPREQCHLAESGVAGRFLAFNADYWREVSQRAWLGTPGAPGSLSLFEGRHSEFAEQICRERLLEKLQGQYGPVWRWTTQPGWHDYGDAVTMCYVAAAWSGIGTGGRVYRPTRRENRKAKVGIML